MAEQPETEPDGRGEFERFEDLAKRLIAVPIAEIDKAVKKAEPALKPAPGSPLWLGPEPHCRGFIQP
jgi:hypothetical protein